MLITVIINSGNKVNLNVTEDTSIAEIEQETARKYSGFNGVWPPDFALSINSVRFDSDRLVRDYKEIVHQATLLIVRYSIGNTSTPKPEIIAGLKESLLNLFTHPDVYKKIALFIGLGSACQSKDRADFQQCPNWFIKMLQTNQMRGIIYLVDTNFGHFETHNVFTNNCEWKKLSGQVRNADVYFHNPPLSITLYTFATNIEDSEYEAKVSIAGISFASLGRALEASGGVLIAGNFYSSLSDPFYISNAAKPYFSKD